VSKKKIIIIPILVVIVISLIYFVAILDCGMKIKEHRTYFLEHCPTDFEELGFETTERCYEVKIAIPYLQSLSFSHST